MLPTFTVETKVAPAQIVHSVKESGRVLAVHAPNDSEPCGWCVADVDYYASTAEPDRWPSATAQHVADRDRSLSLAQQVVRYAHEIDGLRMKLQAAEERAQRLLEAKNRSLDRELALRKDLEASREHENKAWGAVAEMESQKDEWKDTARAYERKIAAIKKAISEG